MNCDQQKMLDKYNAVMLENHKRFNRNQQRIGRNMQKIHDGKGELEPYEDFLTMDSPLPPNL